jgi:aryl-alcohol dehydrogenase-like predicted oxidoreductase
LHSCDIETLERGEVIQALLEAKRAGKVRYIGYSGDREAALWVTESGQFDTLQTTFNLVSQWARSQVLPKAQAKGIGIIYHMKATIELVENDLSISAKVVHELHRRFDQLERSE